MRKNCETCKHNDEDSLFDVPCKECEHTSDAPTMWKPAKHYIQTNADRIRAMSDEELAKLLLDGCRGSKCDDQPQNEYGSVNCFNCRMEWLKQPVKENNNG